MENQNEIVEVVKQDSKKGLKKLALIAAGVAAGVGALIFIKKRKEKQLDEQFYGDSEDSNESEEN